MTKRRFIAGAVCPACGVEDRIVVEELAGGDSGRLCVSCGFNDSTKLARSPVPKSRLIRSSRERTATPSATQSLSAPRKVRIIDRDD